MSAEFCVMVAFHLLRFSNQIINGKPRNYFSFNIRFYQNRPNIHYEIMLPMSFWKCDSKECIHVNYSIFLLYEINLQNSLYQANELTFEGGEKPCNTVYGTPGTAHSVCLPFLLPFLYSASLEEGEASDPDPRYIQSLCGRVCLHVDKKLICFQNYLKKLTRGYVIQLVKLFSL